MTDETKKVEETKEETTAPAEETPQPKEEAKETPAKEEKEDAEVEVPAKFKDLVKAIEDMTVLELNDLVKLLEKKFGVSAAAVAVAPAGGAGGDSGGEEQSEFTVNLTGFGDSKIGVIKAVKEVLGLGLKEAKDLVEGAPTALKEGVKKEEAEEIKKKIEEAGGSVELK